MPVSTYEQKLREHAAAKAAFYGRVAFKPKEFAKVAAHIKEVLDDLDKVKTRVELILDLPGQTSTEDRARQAHAILQQLHRDIWK